MTTSIILAPKNLRGKMVSATNGIVTNTDTVRETLSAMIIHAVKHNVTDKTKAGSISGIIQQALRGNLAEAFKDQPYFKPGFNLEAPKTSKGAYGLKDNRYPFALRKDGTMILRPTWQCAASRTKAWIISLGLVQWEAKAPTDHKLTTQPLPSTTKSSTSKARKAPLFGAKVATTYADAIEAKITACLAGEKAGTYVTKAVFDKRVAKLLAALDIALAA